MDKSNRNMGRKKKSILLIGNVPPPVTGSNLANQYLLESEFSNTFEIDFIDCRFVHDVADMGRFSIYKVLLGIKYIIKMIRCLTYNTYDMVIISFASRGIAVIRDCIMAVISCTLLKKRTLLWMHGNGIIGYDQMNRFFQWSITFTLKKVDKVVLVGDNLRKNMHRWVPPSNLAVVHHGIPPLFENEKRAAHPSTSGIVTVLYFSNMIREKGWLIVLKAAARLKHFDNIRFVFCGAWWPVSDEHYANRLVREWGLENQVIFRGKTVGQDKKHAFAEADIFVFPTFFSVETFGIVNLEAMNAGLPIITTSRAAIPEIVEHNVNGYIIPEQNVDALAERIAYLAERPELRQQIGKRNQEKFFAYFTIDAFARRWIETVSNIPF